MVLFVLESMEAQINVTIRLKNIHTFIYVYTHYDIY